MLKSVKYPHLLIYEMSLWVVVLFVFLHDFHEGKEREADSCSQVHTKCLTMNAKDICNTLSSISTCFIMERVMHAVYWQDPPFKLEAVILQLLRVYRSDTFLPHFQWQPTSNTRSMLLYKDLASWSQFRTTLKGCLHCRFPHGIG